jgi:farnesyl diphosphate synthase
MVRLLARASGSQGMAGGQAIDLESVGATLSMPQLEHMHRMKTGALIEASVLMGALCAPGLSSSERTALEGYAAAMGLAFQIVDDILDAAASTETLGKTAGKDAARNKPTYVAALGLDGAKARAAQLRDQARRSLAPLGEPAQRLRELADFIILRSS